VKTKVVTTDGAAPYVYDPLVTLNRFLRLHQLLLASFTENLENVHDINLNDFRVLMMVGQQGETASHEIAELTGMPVMAISRTVSALEKRGLISRSVDVSNRRRKPIVLTEQGQTLFNTMLPTSERVAHYAFDSLRLDEALAFDHHLQTITDRVLMTDEDGVSVFIASTGPASAQKEAETP